MITANFAPNETAADARAALILLIRPWLWRTGNYHTRVKRRLKNLFFPSTAIISLFFSGRGALYTLLRQLDIPEGSGVMVQGFTCEAVILPIIALGFKPVYCDINADDFSANLKHIEKKYTPRCKVLILQHTFGITPFQREQVLVFAKKKGLFVIEDVAHGFRPGLFKTHLTTTLLLSFGRSKAFSSVFGAAIVTNDRIIGKRLSEQERILPKPSFILLFRVIIYKPITYVVKLTHDWYLGRIIHMFSRFFGLLIPEITKKEIRGIFDTRFLAAFPNCCAYLLLTQLKTWSLTIENRFTISQLYATKLTPSLPYQDDVMTRFPILTKSPDQLIARLKKIHNVHLGAWYRQPIAPSQVPLSTMLYELGSCPVAESVCNSIVNLPTRISRAQAHTVIQAIHTPTS